jgi:hypothetical protein
VYVESESKKVGNLAVPDALMAAMRASPCLDLQLGLTDRVALLLEDYAHFVNDQDLFAAGWTRSPNCAARPRCRRWKQKVRAGDFDTVVRDLLSASTMTPAMNGPCDGPQFCAVMQMPCTVDAGDRSTCVHGGNGCAGPAILLQAQGA